jgi:autotransporter-associated beta strand protein
MRIMQTLKNEFSATKAVFTCLPLMLTLALMLALGGAAWGQTVMDVDRNRFENARITTSGTYTVNVYDGITYTYQNNRWFTNTEGGGALYVSNGVFTLGPVDGGTGRTVFIDNQARRGGALTVASNARAFLTNVRFGSLVDAASGNRSLGDHGGAINLPGGSASLTLRNAEFYRNAAERGTPPGGTSPGGGFGGAIYAIGSGTLEIHDSLFGARDRPDPADFFSNDFTAPAAGSAVDRGTGNWAIDGHGGAIGSFAAASNRIFIYNSQFYHNTAARASLDLHGNGGAIALGNSGGNQQALIVDSLFHGNRSRGGTIGGGALFADSAGVVFTVKDSVFTDNIATNNGGAININNGTLNLIATRDLLYEGNYAATGITNSTPSAGKGGFLYLAAAAAANIDIAPGATLTIGGTADTARDTLAAAATTTGVININSGSAGGDTGGTLLLHGSSTNVNRALLIHAGRVLLGGTDARLTGNNTVTVKAGGTYGGIGITHNVLVENGGVYQVGLETTGDGAGLAGRFMDASGTLNLAGGATLTGHGFIGSATNPDTVYTNAITLGAAAGDWITASVLASATLQINSGTAAITGPGGLVKTGEGTLSLWRTGSYTGGVRLEQGAIHLHNADGLGTGTLGITGTAAAIVFGTGMDITNAIDIAAGASVRLTNDNGAVSLAGAPLTGAGLMEKTGVSELMLNAGASAFTGTVLISQGILSASGDGISAASDVRFGGIDAATYAGNLVRSAGQSLAGSGSINGNLTLNNARLSFDLRNTNDGAPDNADRFLVSGSLTSAGDTRINLDNVGNRATYTLLVAADLSGLTPAHFSVATVNGEPLTHRYDPLLETETVASGTALVVSPGVRNLRMAWAGGDTAAPAAWDTAAGNWSESSGEHYFRHGDSAAFGPTASGAVAIDTAGVTIGDLAVETAAGRTLAFTGGGITGTNALTDSNRHDTNADGQVYLGGGSTATVNGRLVKTGEGTLVLANAANTFAGGIELHSGTLAFDDDAQLGGPGQPIRFINDAALRADANTALAGNVTIEPAKTALFDTRENTLDFTGTLSSAPTSLLAKTGAGDLWISNADHADHLGRTEVREGRLLLGGNVALGGGEVRVSSGATFGGSGTASLVTALPGAVLRVGTPDATLAERLSVSSTLTLHAGAQVHFNIVSGNTDPASSVNSSLMAGGLVIDGGSSADLSIDLDRLATGVYNLGNVSALRDAGITYFGLEVGRRYDIAYESAANSGTLLIKMTLPGNEEMLWTGANGTQWDISTENWQIAGSGSAYSFGDGDKLLFDGVADAANSGNRVITIAGRRMTLSDMVVSGTADYVFRGAAELITDASSATGSLSSSAQGKLHKSGPGTLAFENAGNQFNGGIEIAGGALSFTKAEQLRTQGAGIELASGTLRVAADLITLDEHLVIAAGQSGAIDTPAAGNGAAAGYAMRYTGSLDLAAGGTLSKTGIGALELLGDYSALAGDLRVESDGGELLLRNDAGTMTRLGGAVRVQSGGVLGGEGLVTGTVTVEREGVLRIGATGDGPASLHVADLRLENGAFLHGSGALSGAMTVGSAADEPVTLNTLAGRSLTLSATTGGPGTLVKTGGGALTLSGTAALGHRATRVADGLVYLRDIDSPATAIPALVHSFELAGGWLDLSEVRDYGDVPFVTWDNLAFAGAAGGVIGHGDGIKLGAGDMGFQIGGSGAGRGVFVIVDAGSGTATLSGSSNYVGYTRVDSGVLAISHDTNLGNTDASILAPRDVILNGGNLLVTGNAFASARTLELRQSGTVAVAAGGTASWLDLSGAGAFTKEGEGTLFLTLPGGGASAHTGAKTVAAGVLQGRAGALAGLITTTSGTVALYADEADYPGVFTGTLDGGALVKTGDGNADIGPTAAFRNLVSLRVEEGMLTSSGRSLPLSTTETIDIGDRGILNLPQGGLLETPLVRNQGMIRVGHAADRAVVPRATLRIEGNYHGGASAAAPGYLTLGLGGVVPGNGNVVAADTFHVTGSAAGTTYVTFVRQTANDPFADNLANLAASLPDNVIHVDGGGGEFLQSGRLTYGVKDYLLVYEPGAGTSRWRISLASEIPALLAVDAALMLAEHASLGGLTQRLESMGLLDGYKGRQGFDLWANGLYRRDKFSDTLYSGATASTHGWQAGVDYTDPNLTFALGIFVEKIRTDTDMPRVPGSAQQATGTESDTDAFGAYITYRPSRWFFDLLIRLNTGRYDVNIAETPTFGTDTGGAGISVDIGRYYDLGAGWLLEPQIQFQWSRSNVDNTKDTVPVAGIDDPRTNYAREYRVRALEYSSLRGSLMLSRRLVTRRGWELRPYARASYAGEFGGDTEMTVFTIGETVKYDNALGGAYGLLNGGATVRIRDRLDLWADFAWYYAGKIDGHSFNLGAGWRF